MIGARVCQPAGGSLRWREPLVRLLAYHPTKLITALPIGGAEDAVAVLVSREFPGGHHRRASSRF